MNSRNNRVIFLLTGVAIGVIIGGAVIWWHLSGFDMPDFSSNNRNNEGRDDYLLNKKQKQKKESQYKKSSWIDAAGIPDSLLVEGDELSDDSSMVTDNSSGSDIVVARDELLFIKYIKVSGSFDGSMAGNELDSLLLDDRSSGNRQKNVVHVEFWRSPINYRGYKFDGSRLILFGIYEYDDFRLLTYDHRLYMKYTSDYYPLRPVADFAALTPVREAALLKELKSL